jgi:hypothetical protein
VIYLSDKKVLGKSLKSLYQENNKEDIKGFNFNKKNNKINICVSESKSEKYHIINR